MVKNEEKIMKRKAPLIANVTASPSTKIDAKP